MDKQQEQESGRTRLDEIMIRHANLLPFDQWTTREEKDEWEDKYKLILLAVACRDAQLDLDWGDGIYARLDTIQLALAPLLAPIDAPKGDEAGGV